MGAPGERQLEEQRLWARSCSSAEDLRSVTPPPEGTERNEAWPFYENKEEKTPSCTLVENSKK